MADSPYTDNYDELISLIEKIERGEQILGGNSASDSYLLPNCIFVPGHLHMIWNALEDALKKDPQ